MPGQPIVKLRKVKLESFVLKVGRSEGRDRKFLTRIKRPHGATPLWAAIQNIPGGAGTTTRVLRISLQCPGLDGGTSTISSSDSIGDAKPGDDGGECTTWYSRSASDSVGDADLDGGSSTTNL